MPEFKRSQNETRTKLKQFTQVKCTVEVCQVLQFDSTCNNLQRKLNIPCTFYFDIVCRCDKYKVDLGFIDMVNPIDIQTLNTETV